MLLDCFGLSLTIPLDSVALRGDVNQAQVKLIRRNCSPWSAHRTAQTMLSVPNLSRCWIPKTHRQSKNILNHLSCPLWPAKPSKRNEFRQIANKRLPAALRPSCLRKACQLCAYLRPPTNLRKSEERQRQKTLENNTVRPAWAFLMFFPNA